MTHGGFKVRVFVNGSSPLVLRGGRDMGAYIETREASGTGRSAISRRRIYVNDSLLRPLKNDLEADFELTHPLPSSAFE